MSDYGHYGASDEEHGAIRKLIDAVEAEPDNFEHWENLIKSVDSLEGGPNRNSSPQALATFRNAYDRLLAKFPLLFGYWKKYADAEFAIAGPESAVMVYERGCANITNSVDLWTSYCNFKMDTTHDTREVRDRSTQRLARKSNHDTFKIGPYLQGRGRRALSESLALLDPCVPFHSFSRMSSAFPPQTAPETEPAKHPMVIQSLVLFERGAQMVGLDFLAHPFWDKYIEYEERQEAQDRVCALLIRIVSIPMHQYARYYERLRGLVHSRPLNEVMEQEELSALRARAEAEAAAHGVAQRPEMEVERDLRAKIDAHYYEIFTKTQEEVSKRWTYESEIKRPYFHVTELDHEQLANWRKYLDFEEENGDHSRVVCLYERCLVTCAFYDEFWFRYARWMHAQDDSKIGRDYKQEVRHIYIRASSTFVPVSRPGIRLQWAFFEEAMGRLDIARDIHEAILVKLPDCIEVVVSWAHLQRRQEGLEAAVQVLKDHINSPTVDLYTKAALVGEWATLLWTVKGSAEEARSVLRDNAQWYADSRIFWDKWFQFELELPSRGEAASAQAKHVKHVFDELCSKSRLSGAVKRELSQNYLKFLVQQGGKSAMQAYLAADCQVYGPPGAVFKLSKNGKHFQKGELDEASKPKAEARYTTFYEMHPEARADVTGPADFN